MNKLITKYKFKPRVAVGLFIVDKNTKEILLFKRKKKDGLENIWGPICGKLEYLESISEGICREALEEANFKIKKDNLKFLGISERKDEYPHFIVLWHTYYVDQNNLKIEHCSREFSKSDWFELERVPNKLPDIFVKYLKELKND